MKNKVKITVKYGVVWQKRSSGRRYHFSSGHAFIIGERSKGIIEIVLYSKVCQKRDAEEKRREEKKQKNMSAKTDLSESQKVLRLLQF